MGDIRGGERGRDGAYLAVKNEHKVLRYFEQF